MKLSVCLITMNEADRVERCLESIKDIADEIIVFDSGSVDDTVSIVKRYTSLVWQTDWPGFGAQRQRTLDKATGDWVLIIDADEAPDETLQNSISRLKQRNDADIEEVGFKLQWAVIRHGKRLKYGRSARAPLRLLRREGTWYHPDQVHERLNHKAGKIGKLPGYLLHFTSRDFGHALDKNAKYAWLGSQRNFARGKRNKSLALVCLRALWTFFLIYIIRGGILDGRIGFIVAMNYAMGNFNKHVGLWLLSQQEKGRFLDDDKG
ncbi:MAG: glycosyltransferase family 2 protein [Saccharospirillum sp.]|nr:glycosyltransferase family 2 protein [Saccharospirillum sp.]